MMCTVQKKETHYVILATVAGRLQVGILNMTVWFCKLPPIMEINDALRCAKLKHFVWTERETEGSRPEAHR